MKRTIAVLFGVFVMVFALAGTAYALSEREAERATEEYVEDNVDELDGDFSRRASVEDVDADCRVREGDRDRRRGGDDVAFCRFEATVEDRRRWGEDRDWDRDRNRDRGRDRTRSYTCTGATRVEEDGRDEEVDILFSRCSRDRR